MSRKEHQNTGQESYRIRPQDIDRIEVNRWERDVTISYKLRPHAIPRYEERGDISGFSDSSMRRLAFVAQNTTTDFSHMVTLTYPSEFPCDGKKVKQQLNVFLQRLRRKGIKYLWFLEWQRRGAPHFHVLIDGLNGLTKGELSNAWYEIVGSGDEKHLRAGTRLEKMRNKEGGRHYAVKYSYKRYQKQVPEGYTNVGRLWGHSQSVAPKVRATKEIYSLMELLRLFEQDSWIVQAIHNWLEGETEFPPTLVFGINNQLALIDQEIVKQVNDEQGIMELEAIEHG